MQAPGRASGPGGVARESRPRLEPGGCMASIDGLLGIVVSQEATELRLGANRRPRLFRGGEERPLTLPATSPEMLESMLRDLLSPHQTAIRERGRASFAYRSEAGVDFDVIVSRQPGTSDADLDVCFMRA